MGCKSTRERVPPESEGVTNHTGADGNSGETQPSSSATRPLPVLHGAEERSSIDNHFDPIPYVERRGSRGHGEDEDEDENESDTHNNSTRHRTDARHQRASTFNTPLEDQDRTDALGAAEEYTVHVQAKHDAQEERRKQLRIEEFDPVRPLDSFNITHRGLLGRCCDRRAQELLPISFIHYVTSLLYEQVNGGPALSSGELPDQPSALHSPQIPSRCSSQLLGSPTDAGYSNGVPRHSHWFSVCGASAEVIPKPLQDLGIRAAFSTSPTTQDPRHFAFPGKSNTDAASMADTYERYFQQYCPSFEQLAKMSLDERQEKYNLLIGKNPRYKGLKDHFAFAVSPGVSDSPNAQFLLKRNLKPAAGTTLVKWDHVEFSNPDLRMLARAVAATEGKTELPSPFDGELSLASLLSSGGATAGRAAAPRPRGTYAASSTALDALVTDGQERSHPIGRRLAADLENRSFPAVNNVSLQQQFGSAAQVRQRQQTTVISGGGEKLDNFPKDSVLSLALAIPATRLMTLEGAPPIRRPSLMNRAYSVDDASRVFSSLTAAGPGVYSAAQEAARRNTATQADEKRWSTITTQTQLVAVTVSNFSVSIDPMRNPEAFTKHSVDVDDSKKSARRMYGEGVITDVMYGGALVLECSSAHAAQELERILKELPWAETRSTGNILSDVQRHFKARRLELKRRSTKGNSSGAGTSSASADAKVPTSPLAPASAGGKDKSRVSHHRSSISNLGSAAEMDGIDDHQFRIVRRIGGKPMRDAVEFSQISVFFGDAAPRKESSVGAGSEASAADPEASVFSRVASAWVGLQTITAVVRTWGLHLLSNPEYAQPTALYLQKFSGIAPALQCSAFSGISHAEIQPASDSDSESLWEEEMGFFARELEYGSGDSNRAGGGGGHGTLGRARRIPKYNRFYASQPSSAASTPQNYRPLHHSHHSHHVHHSHHPPDHPQRRTTMTPHSIGLGQSAGSVGPKCHSRDTLPGTGLTPLDSSDDDEDDDYGDGKWLGRHTNGADRRQTSNATDRTQPMTPGRALHHQFSSDDDEDESTLPHLSIHHDTFVFGYTSIGSQDLAGDKSQPPDSSDKTTKKAARVGRKKAHRILPSCSSATAAPTPTSISFAGTTTTAAGAEEGTPEKEASLRTKSAKGIAYTQRSFGASSTHPHTEEEGEALWHMAMLEVKALHLELSEIQNSITEAEDNYAYMYKHLNTLHKSFLPHTATRELDLTFLYLKAAIFDPGDLARSRLFLHSQDWLALLAAALTAPTNTVRCIDIAVGLQWRDLPKLGILTGLVHHQYAGQFLEQFEINARQLLGPPPPATSDLSGSSKHRSPTTSGDFTPGLYSAVQWSSGLLTINSAAGNWSGSQNTDGLPFYITPEQARDTLWLLLGAIAATTTAPTTKVQVRFRDFPSAQTTTPDAERGRLSFPLFLSQRKKNDRLVPKDRSLCLEPFVVRPGQIPDLLQKSPMEQSSAGLLSSFDSSGQSARSTPGSTSRRLGKGEKRGKAKSQPYKVNVHNPAHREWMHEEATVDVRPFCNVLCHSCSSLPTTPTSECGGPMDDTPMHYHNEYNNQHNNANYYVPMARRWKLADMRRHSTESSAGDNELRRRSDGPSPSRVFGLKSREEEATVLREEEARLRSSADDIWTVLLRAVKHFNKAHQQRGGSSGSAASDGKQPRCITLGK